MARKRRKLPELVFVPRRELVERLRGTHRLVEGMDYNPLDWAILMAVQPDAAPLTETEIASAVNRFKAPKHSRYRHLRDRSSGLYYRAKLSRELRAKQAGAAA